MKAITITAALAFACTAALVQAADMNMNDMHHDHAAMTKAADQTQATHQAVGEVKKLNAKLGTVSIAHEAVASLKWPAMTMAFKVHDKALLGKLALGKKVNFEFQERGKEYVIVAVK